eukprot:6189027-Pyramimonas_sp.AAC.1
MRHQRPHIYQQNKSSSDNAQPHDQTPNSPHTRHPDNQHAKRPKIQTNKPIPPNPDKTYTPVFPPSCRVRCSNQYQYRPMPVFTKSGLVCVSAPQERFNPTSAWVAEVTNIDGHAFVATDKQDSKFVKFVGQQFEMLNFLAAQRNDEVDRLMEAAARDAQRAGPGLDVDKAEEPATKKARRDA